MKSYPYTIENGAGEKLTFTHRATYPGGDRVEGGTIVAPGAGPPMHVHYLQEEGFTVLKGRIGYQRGSGPPEYGEAGVSIVFLAGEPHRFWNAGEDDLHCSAYIQPAGNAEYFLSEVFASQLRNGGRRPGLLDIAFLTRRYRTEFAMLAIPAVVQQLVFPVFVALGKLLGTYKRFADAPPPLAAPTRSDLQVSIGSE